MSPAKIRCPHCSAEATQINAFLLQKSNLAYCNNCSWNIDKATARLRMNMRAMWLVSGLGILLASMAWIRGPYGFSGAALIFVPFVGLPLLSGLFSRYRLSTISLSQVNAPAGIGGAGMPTWSPRAFAEQTDPAGWAIRPRVVHLTMRGYAYAAVAMLAAAFVLWLLFRTLRGFAGLSNTSMVSLVFAIFGCSFALWQCVSFFRDRLRERRLFAEGELAQGLVLNRTQMRNSTRIAYSYRDARGTSFQNRATDFTSQLFEEMPIHVFYDPADPGRSVALEGSLYRIGDADSFSTR